MIYGKSRQVVVIRDVKSDFIEQAILIVKSDVPQKEYYKESDDIVKEAQKIINEYVTGIHQTKRRRWPKVMFTAACIALFVMAAALVLNHFV